MLLQQSKDRSGRVERLEGIETIQEERRLARTLKSAFIVPRQVIASGQTHLPSFGAFRDSFAQPADIVNLDKLGIRS